MLTPDEEPADLIGFRRNTVIISPITVNPKYMLIRVYTLHCGKSGPEVLLCLSSHGQSSAPQYDGGGWLELLAEVLAGGGPPSCNTADDIIFPQI